jgi:hypothetical protein
MSGDHRRNTGPMLSSPRCGAKTRSGRPAGRRRCVENDDVECTAALQARALRVVTGTRCGMEHTHAKLLLNIGNCVHS